MKARIVWRKGKSGAKWMFWLGPSFWGGGTCEYRGLVLIYDELPGDLKVEGGCVLYKGRRDVGFADFCDLADVAAIFDEGGRQIYPIAPAD